LIATVIGKLIGFFVFPIRVVGIDSRLFWEMTVHLSDRQFGGGAGVARSPRDFLTLDSYFGWNGFV
jgi:hypothetical protein